MASERILEFHYDFVCPYAYLGFTGVERLAAECGAALVLKPILLGGVFRAIGAPDAPSMPPAKARLSELDIQRWARQQGVELRKPEGHPRRTVLALRSALASGDLLRASTALYEAYWKRGEDLESKEVVAAALDRAGLDGRAAIANGESEEIKAELRRRTDEAVAKGIFGVPAYVTRTAKSTELFWGQDRTDFVRHALTGEWPLREELPALSTPRTVPFYFDFSSPFAYLGSTQISAFAQRTGATLEYRPILLGALFNAIGTPNVPLFAMPAPKQAYVAIELERWAARWGVPFRPSSRFPINTVRPLRIVLSAEPAQRPRLIDAFFRAVWADDLDLTDESVLASVVTSAGADPSVLLPASLADAAKAALREATAQAQARGVFGVPTLEIGDELYWGQDRLTLAEQALLSR